jgi:hypothetical protein
VAEHVARSEGKARGGQMGKIEAPLDRVYLGNEAFSVWGFNAERVEDGSIVTWKEECENGTRHIRIAVRTEEEFNKAIERFARNAKKTWPLL